MLFIIGTISTFVSLIIVNNMRCDKEKRIKKYGRVMYTQNEINNWEKEFTKLYLFAYIPITFCGMTTIMLMLL